MKPAFPFVAVLLATTLASTPPARSQTTLPGGYLPLAESQALVDRTLHVHLSPDVSKLTPAERACADKIIAAGKILDDLNDVMRHKDAATALAALEALDRKLGSPADTRNLRQLYYSSKGPISRMLDNSRKPFLPVAPPAPGGTIYPWGVTKEEIDAYLTAHPDQRTSLLDPRTAVRRADRASLKTDIAMLKKHGVLDGLHPGLRASLEARARQEDAKAFYAVPYAVAYGDELVRVHGLLTEAAALIAPEDEDFAAYLRNRARDLIANDYESGDAAWVSGRFKTLNAQIGSYESYDDELYGTKTYFSCNVLMRDNVQSDAVRARVASLQQLEDALPYDEGKPHKRVRSDIPVGVYDVIADFGQSLGANTATILPNDAAMARKYGRTILLRRNIMEAPAIFAGQRDSFQAAVASQFANDFTAEAGSQRTLWHEVGHYLGVDRTRDGRDLDAALEQASPIYEEMKADLVSLHVSGALEKAGYYTAEKRRNLYASGVRRILLKNRPDRAQVYQTMQLMQWNYYLAQGVLTFDAASGKLAIHYDKFPAAVELMLREVLEIQAAGDRAAAEAYITKWTEWHDDLHERVAKSMREAEKYRYTVVTYELLGPRW